MESIRSRYIFTLSLSFTQSSVYIRTSWYYTLFDFKLLFKVENILNISLFLDKNAQQQQGKGNKTKKRKNKGKNK